DSAAADDRDALHAQRLRGKQAARMAGEQIHARNPRPLTVRLEQLGRLPAFDRPAAQRAQQLDEAEVADEAVVVTAEAFEADDADRPRPEAALAPEPRCDDAAFDVVETFELDRAAEPDERGPAARVEPEGPQLRGSKSSEIRGCRRDVQSVGPFGADRTDDRLLEAARSLRFDQLSAER